MFYCALFSASFIMLPVPFRRILPSSCDAERQDSAVSLAGVCCLNSGLNLVGLEGRRDGTQSSRNLIERYGITFSGRSLSGPTVGWGEWCWKYIGVWSSGTDPEDHFSTVVIGFLRAERVNRRRETERERELEVRCKTADTAVSKSVQLGCSCLDVALSLLLKRPYLKAAIRNYRKKNSSREADSRSASLFLRC
jgi:hypothetical protein